MKTKLSVLVLCILAASLCGCTTKETITVDANVLTVNSEIIEGKLIGQFLSSSSGWIRSDVIKVGVKFEINNNLFLEDLKLSHAQLAYFKDKDTLPLEVTIIMDEANCRWSFEIRLKGYYITNRYISRRLAKELINYIRTETTKVIVMPTVTVNISK